mmetsp:Transcript_61976/g.191935  ORF Transcript_61976/g.191935 Transcript_61976/m.191935 type:complete len:360 (-) Transcript_61976:18-1097(-)
MEPVPSRSQASCSIAATCRVPRPGTRGKLARQIAAVNSSHVHVGDLHLDRAESCSSAAMQQPYFSAAHFLKVARTMAIFTSTSLSRAVPSSSTSMAFQSATTSPRNPILRQPFRSSTFDTARLPFRSRVPRQPRMKLPPETARTLLRNSRSACLRARWCRSSRLFLRFAAARAASRPISKTGLRVISRLRASDSRTAMSRSETVPTPSRSRISWKIVVALPSYPYFTQASWNSWKVSEPLGSLFSALNMLIVPPNCWSAQLWKLSMQRLSSGESSRRPTAGSSQLRWALRSSALQRAEASPSQETRVKASMNSEKKREPLRFASSARRQAFMTEPYLSARNLLKLSMTSVSMAPSTSLS